MKEARRVEHTSAEKRRALLGALCFLGGLGCALAGIQTWGWASHILGGTAILLCIAGYMLGR